MTVRSTLELQSVEQPAEVSSAAGRRREMQMASTADVMRFADDEAPAASSKKHCPSCRAEMARTATFCVACGFNLTTGQRAGAIATEDDRFKQPGRQGHKPEKSAGMPVQGQAIVPDERPYNEWIKHVYVPIALLVIGLLLQCVGVFAIAVAEPEPLPSVAVADGPRQGTVGVGGDEADLRQAAADAGLELDDEEPAGWTEDDADYEAAAAATDTGGTFGLVEFGLFSLFLLSMNIFGVVVMFIGIVLASMYLEHSIQPWWATLLKSAAIYVFITGMAALISAFTGDFALLLNLVIPLLLTMGLMSYLLELDGFEMWIFTVVVLATRHVAVMFFPAVLR